MSGIDRATADPDGREVVFDAGSHLHLALARPQLLDHIDLILATVEHPDYREPDPRAGRERFYRRHLLDPRRWLRVVVDFNELPGWVVTAVVQDKDPRRSC
jgi:hypothetical protein